MFCNYCGNELPENAAICMGCGCMVSRTRKIREEQFRQPKEISDLLLKIIILATIVISCLSVMFYCYAIGNLRAFETSYSISIYIDDALQILGFVFAVLGLIMGIVITILSFFSKNSTLKFIIYCILIFTTTIFSSGIGLLYL